MFINWNYGTVDNTRHGRHLIFCAVSFDGVIISEGRYKFYRCFSHSCKIFRYPLFQIRVKLGLAILMYRLIDTILKVKFAPSLIVVTLCARTAMFLSRELHKLCNLSRNA